ncbi:Crp/Fnr family transcriptional regulator [Undibacterium sp. Ji67W]|uniref:Crp/Fnr family transcriptional regulator n=1 Tax=Undibacterium sp. Ji67W TaxID=3413042 RepID=UPI003BEF7198
MNILHSPLHNHLLAAIPAASLKRLVSHLELVEMPLGQTLYEADMPIEHVFFPTTSVVSLLYVLENGTSAEIAIVGNEGIIGISLFMGGESTSSQAIVQSAGVGYRLNAEFLKDEFSRAGPFLRLLLRYTQALITQMTQTAVCNRHHSLEQQFCRWLLLSLDRIPVNDIKMTQGLVANMLGVRKNKVGTATGELERLGIIHYRNGRINVLKRAELEHHVCECYGVVKHEYQRLLSEIDDTASLEKQHVLTIEKSAKNHKHLT